MRVLFLALMIALLPLRGWVGDAMAMDMLALAQGAAHSSHANATPVHDCHTLAADGAGGDASEPQAPPMQMSADCNTCSACQICHTVALPAIILPLNGVGTPTLQPAHPAGLFASADRAPGFKPPIL